MTSDAGLREGSRHLLYEIDMVEYSADKLALLGIGETRRLSEEEERDEYARRNLYIEAFATHARCLINFLFPGRTCEDDILINDFLEPHTWNLTAKSLCDEKEYSLLKEVKVRADKRLAHLTYRRDTDFDWYSVSDRVLAELADLILEFLDAVPIQRIDAKLLDWRSRYIGLSHTP